MVTLKIGGILFFMFGIFNNVKWFENEIIL
jgi:hypothetical protein